MTCLTDIKYAKNHRHNPVHHLFNKIVLAQKFERKCCHIDDCIVKVAHLQEKRIEKILFRVGAFMAL